MKPFRVFNILTILSLVSLMGLGFVILGQSATVGSVYIKAIMFNFVLSIVMFGIYLINNHRNKNDRQYQAILLYAAFIVVFAYLILFNIMDFTSGWNWLISGMILFILLVQLKKLSWGKNHGVIVKFCAFLILITNTFLAIFFVTIWEFSELSIWIDLSILVSILSFTTGIIFSRKKNNPHPVV